mmetsp:Transcript_33425/g.72196  ORF Transcript_33425/g.72196 Transcript_33425/m.72196 type:complete len:209 (-) Transcript_33425:287-913(-)
MRGVRREGKEMTMRRGKRYRRAVSARVRYRVGTRTFASRPDNGRRRPFLELEGQSLQSFGVGLSRIVKSHVVKFDHYILRIGIGLRHVHRIGVIHHIRILHQKLRKVPKIDHRHYDRIVNRTQIVQRREQIHRVCQHGDEVSHLEAGANLRRGAALRVSRVAPEGDAAVHAIADADDGEGEADGEAGLDQHLLGDVQSGEGGLDVDAA